VEAPKSGVEAVAMESAPMKSAKSAAMKPAAKSAAVEASSSAAVEASSSAAVKPATAATATAMRPGVSEIRRAERGSAQQGSCDRQRPSYPAPGSMFD